MLELKNITKIYNPGQVTEMCLFDKFNLTVSDGQFVSIVGSNGSGFSAVSFHWQGLSKSFHRNMPKPDHAGKYVVGG